ncbi:MAG: HIT family protein [Acidobacteriota bacterium]
MSHASSADTNPAGPTIFDRILDGELPCHRVYEDEHVLAFLDIGPLAPGHTLVIPKERRAHLHELSDAAAAAIGRVLPRIARAVMAAVGATAYNVLQNNGPTAHQAVMHVHFHIIPRFEERGLGIGWQPGALALEDAEHQLSVMHAALAEEPLASA